MLYQDGFLGSRLILGNFSEATDQATGSPLQLRRQKAAKPASLIAWAHLIATAAVYTARRK